MILRGWKKLICVLLSVVFVLGLMGCSSSQGKTIIIALPMGSEKPVWEALAADYMSLNPDVEVKVKDKDAAEYSNWLIKGFASGEDLEADIITVNEIASYIPEGKVLKLDNYLNKITPYAQDENGDPVRWRDVMEEDAYRSSLDNKFIIQDNSTYCISMDRVQVALFYNKKIFEQCGIKQLPRTWDELVAVCETISKYQNPETGEYYSPLSIPGETRALTYYYNWLVRIYSDQYFRDLEPSLAYQPQDYFYDVEREGEWTFDINDINNDKTSNVGFNTVRLASQVYNGGEASVKTDKFQEMMENFRKIFPEYALPDFTSATLGYEYYYFYNAQAAMILDASWFVTDFPEKMKKPYQTGFKQFDYGILYLPPMGAEVNAEGEVVKMADSCVASTNVRSLGGAAGYYGCINKSKEQNDLNADFLMYFASPRGQTVRLNAMKKSGLAPKGTILLKDFQMDSEWQSLLDQIEYRGECDYNPATVFTSGWMGDQESKRGFYALSQQFFMDEITIKEMQDSLHKELQKGIDRWIVSNNYKSDCLQYPERNPSIS